LKAKLSAGFIVVTICCAAIAGAFVDRNVRRTTLASFEDRLSYETTMLSQMTASALFGEVDPKDTSLNESVQALGAAVHTQLSIMAKDGTIVADSETEGDHTTGSQASAPEIVSARETGSGTAIRDGRMYVARAIVRDEKTLGFARSSVPMTEVAANVLSARERMALGSTIALLIATILGLAFSSRIVRPIRAVSDGARRVGAGDFEHMIAVTTSDEIGELARSFNDMTKSLRDTVARLDGRNRDMLLVLDNVTQGLLTVDRRCVVSKEKSAIVEKWFGPAPEGTDFAEYIRRVDPRAAATFALQWYQIQDAFLPVDLLLDQLPKRLEQGEQLFELSYTPIFHEHDIDQLDKLLIVISDATGRVAAERAEAEQRQVALVLERAARDKSGVLDFLLGAEAQVQALTSEQRLALVETKRTLHTLKGNCALFGLQAIAAQCNDIETRMQESGGDLSPADITALGRTWTAIATRLSAVLGSADQVTIEDDEYAALLRAILDGTSRSEVARMVRDWRMERVVDRLERFAEHARELGRRLHKDVEVEVVSPGLRLPREEWSAFWAELAHAIRNAVDHGIESNEERSLKGKPKVGRIRLEAVRDGRSVTIEVTDDGRGIQWDAIAARARGMGLPATRHEDLVSALFTDGLSTKAEASDISGRGVGLGALREACSRLGGTIVVESEPGRGTALRFRVPLRENGPSLRPCETERPAPGPQLGDIASP
jgi:two-component system chemotaxis sensor kinase CheA